MAGCAEPTPAGRPSDSAQCTSLDWSTFGQGFFATWCDSCHAAASVGASRQGAPDQVVFDHPDQVRAQSDRIWARVLDDPATMPPLVPIPEADRSRLAEWLACGAPGEPAVAPSAPCDDPAVLAGEVRWSTEAELVPAREGLRIEGSLTLTGAAAAGQVVAGLCAVTGPLAVEGGAGSLDFPDLRRVGALVVEGSLGSLDLRLPALTEVEGDLALGPAGPSGALELPALVRVGGQLTVQDSAALEGLDLWRLEEVGGQVRIENLALLDRLVGLDDLGRVGGPVRLAQLPRLARWRGLSFLEGFSLELVDLPALEQVQVGLWSERVGDLHLEALPVLTEATLAPLAVQLGDLALIDLPALVTLDGGWRAESSGSLRVARTGLRALGPLDGLRVVGGDLELTETELRSLGALLTLERVDGGLALRDNPLLPAGAQEELVQAIDFIGGPIQVDRD